LLKVPIIDVEPLLSKRCERHGVAQEVNRACREFGFFYIKNHGVARDDIERVLDLSRSFFAQPIDAKLQIAMARAAQAWRGYFPLGQELTSGLSDQKEGIYFGQEHDKEHPYVKAKVALHGQNLYPDPQWRQVINQYMARLEALGHNLMAGISLSLGLPEDYFYRQYTKDPFLLFRIFHYPALAETNHQQWGVGEHTDYGLLTMLYQDEVGGLQVKTPKGWIDAPYIPDTFICNIGDMLDYLTSGYYRSTPHRVRNVTDQSRISLPFFFDPNFDAKMRVLPLEQTAGVVTSDRWDKTNLHEFKGTYGNYLLSKVSKVFPELQGYAHGGSSDSSHQER